VIGLCGGAWVKTAAFVTAAPASTVEGPPVAGLGNVSMGGSGDRKLFVRWEANGSEPAPAGLTGVGKVGKGNRSTRETQNGFY
jgi:hypothetical protein